MVDPDTHTHTHTHTHKDKLNEGQTYYCASDEYTYRHGISRGSRTRDPNKKILDGLLILTKDRHAIWSGSEISVVIRVFPWTLSELCDKILRK